MALANVGDILARAGLRILMIDFDLEAPGLEQYFQVDQRAVRAHLGLLDLIVRYKREMSSASISDAREQEFRRLRELFITEIYPQHASGGKLDLITAGQRGDDEQLSQYALTLRQFDWQDFYFNWGGELFFEWLRRSLDKELYDLVLVDSRTGVTEMGGICAYQLADVIVVLCATNQQNLEGTHDVVRNFFSPRVRMLRGDRDLRLIVVPARIELRDELLLEGFRKRFEELFERFVPSALAQAGLTFWDLLIPYEPQYAFQERVLATRDLRDRRSAIRPALQKLVDAIGALADTGDPIRNRGIFKELPAAAAEPQYDLTSRSAGFDVYVSYRRVDRDAVGAVAKRLKERGLRLFFEEEDLSIGDDFSEATRRSLEQSHACAIFVGPSGEYPWRQESFRAAVEARIKVGGFKLVPILLPGASIPTVDDLPPYLAGMQWHRIEGLHDEHDIEQLARVLTTDAPSRLAATTVAEVSPYRGLLPFGEADAPFFFGRDELIQKMVRSLRDGALLAVVGASGVGKTSVVCAGLIPALRRGAIPGAQRWKYIILRPGYDPVRNLLESVARVSGIALTSDEVKPAPSDLLSRLKMITAGERYLLVIDQFEELIINPHDSSEQRVFIETLAHIAANPSMGIAIVLAVRSEYIDKFLDLRPLAELIEHNLMFVGSLSESEMRAVIEEPARKAGLALEPGLTELIMKDMAQAPGALPLLQYAMARLWDGRRSGYLTVDAYQHIGGALGAIARNADEFLQQLPDEDVEAAFSILLRLVSVTPEGTVFRRPARISELIPAGRSSEETTRRILERLVDARIVVGSSSEGRDSVYDLAHEAITRQWPRLRQRIEEETQWLQERSRLAAAAQQWVIHGRSADFLYQGVALARATELARQARHALGDVELEFLRASRIRRVRRVAVAYVSAVGFAVLAGMSAFVYGTKERALKQEEQALKQAEQARIIAEQARESDALANLGAASVISPDGRRLLTVDLTGRVRMIDLVTGKDIGSISEEKAISAAAFSPDGKRVATGAVTGRISIWDSVTLAAIVVQAGHDDVVRRITFSPDGVFVASGSDDKTARIWSAETGVQRIVIRVAKSSVVGIAFSPDGRRLIISSADGTQYIADPTTGRIISQVSR
jgi:hypothetical protein